MTAPLISVMPVNDCPLCLMAALSERAPEGDYTITCSHCGAFVVTDTARAMLLSLPNRFRIALTRAVHDSAAQGKTTRITVQNVAQLVAPYL